MHLKRLGCDLTDDRLYRTRISTVLLLFWIVFNLAFKLGGVGPEKKWPRPYERQGLNDGLPTLGRHDRPNRGLIPGLQGNFLWKFPVEFFTENFHLDSGTWNLRKPSLFCFFPAFPLFGQNRSAGRCPGVEGGFQIKG